MMMRYKVMIDDHDFEGDATVCSTHAGILPEPDVFMIVATPVSDDAGCEFCDGDAADWQVRDV